MDDDLRRPLKVNMEFCIQSMVQTYRDIVDYEPKSPAEHRLHRNMMEFIREYVKCLPVDVFMKLPDDMRDFAMEEGDDRQDTDT